jgi:hypothetical protein
MKPTYDIASDMLIKLAETTNVKFDFEENAIVNLEIAQNLLVNAGYEHEALAISGILAKYASLEEV